MRELVTGMADEQKTYEPARCGHCEGIGCTYCNKTGIVLVRAPKTICPECEGVGCIYCGFTGWSHPKGKYD
jgi:DnaJ-class molecular chaperone